MQPERKIGMLLSELGIDGELKEGLSNIIIHAMEVKRHMRGIEPLLISSDILSLKYPKTPESGIFCGFCKEYFKEYPHYCQQHVTVSHQSRYWIDDQAYCGSRIPNCS